MLKIIQLTIVLIVLLILAGVSTAHEVTKIEKIPAELFIPIETSIIKTPYPEIIKDFIHDSDSKKPHITTPAPSPKVVVKSTPKPTPKPTTKPKPRVTGAIEGKASWYCKAGRSICRVGYPDRAGINDYFAAACASLRHAMGKYMGRYVTVTRKDTGESIKVKIVDKCASTDKTIDLYWDAMHKLGGTGVLRVKVEW